MDKYNGEVGRAKETNKGNGEGWEESSGNIECRHDLFWYCFAMVLCNYFAGEGS